MLVSLASFFRGAMHNEKTSGDWNDRKIPPDASQPRFAAGFSGIPGVLIGPLMIVAASCAMAYWTWGTWPDVVVDFGRELYIPWQVASGKVLYKDIAIFHGPL